MAYTKRTSTEIIRDRKEIAKLYLDGLTQQEIVEQFNCSKRPYTLTQQMISYDMQKLKKGLGIKQYHRGPGYVYLIRENFKGLVKVGFSRCIDKRLSNMKSEYPQDIEIIHLFYTTEPELLERTIHREFKNKKFKSEWFELTENDISNIIIDFADFKRASSKIEYASEIDKALESIESTNNKVDVQMRLSLQFTCNTEITKT